MPIQQPEDDASSFDGLSPKRILTEWTEAITNLYKNYQELSAYIDQAIGQEAHFKEDTNTYIGQCPLSQLVTLVTTIQVELEKLLQDVSKKDSSTKLNPRNYYQKLIEHTLLVDQLNQQARSRLHLLSLSAS
ncbi:hypothetical protein [Spirosoma foliorum]|uniref:Uncharacterized protein n=1 Tax=Spirosoma foliorum TaxID=2710596 RepID=A0A7G5GYB0_9BACT|nr:hypothetical protein [Spirosoma foliorum]QMW03852.1 hypothetical protein H3H32_02525 [Spirosoma foliorum]